MQFAHPTTIGEAFELATEREIAVHATQQAQSSVVVAAAVGTEASVDRGASMCGTETAYTTAGG